MQKKILRQEMFLKKLGFVIEKEVPYVCSGGELTTTGILCRFTHK
ncbi:MAG: hypothetical protein PHW47_13685 [Lachnospira sp.]|nr:hypothetical protein [Lachnospira sp.]